MLWKRIIILNLLIQFSFVNFLWAGTVLFEPENFCRRSFAYHDRRFEMDSTRKLDAEGLRFVLKKNPKSEALLNKYQQNLQSPVWPSYMGLVGLTSLLVGPTYSLIANSRGSISNETMHQVTVITVTGGLGLLLGSYLISQIYKKSNQSNLDDAVKSYNRSEPPSNRIQVGIGPLPEGGAQVNTTVPF